MTYYLNRRNSEQLNPKKNDKDDDIVSSFYNERQSRPANVKQHNLLKKNISFFNSNFNQKEQENVTRMNSEDQAAYVSIDKIYNQRVSKDQKQRSKSTYSRSLMATEKTIEREDIEKAQGSGYNMVHDKSELNYRQNLRKELNKRINIKAYLKEINLEDKENQNCQSNNHLKDQNKSQNQESKYTIFHNISNDKNLNEPDYQHFSMKRSRERKSTEKDNQISESRNSFQSEAIKNIYEISKNEYDQTERINRSFGKQNKIFDQTSFTQENSKNTSVNILNQTQKQPLKYHNYSYFDPQIQTNYKRKIKDLQIELEQLKKKSSKQQKFIESIQKMRKTLLGKQEDCSLKQLWRWIKALPKA